MIRPLGTLFGLLPASVVLPFLAIAPAFAQEAYRVHDFEIPSTPPPIVSSDPSDFFNTDGALFFLASTPSTLRAVWTTDGTSVGTELLRYPCLYNYGCGADPQFLGHLGRVALWQETPSDTSRPEEIWRSDGTRAGTFELLEGDAFTPVATPTGLVFFHCDTPGCGFWRTDGTVAGTRALLTFLPPPTEPFSIFGATLSGPRPRIVFGADAPASAPPGATLWVSDGTSAGSFQLATWKTSITNLTGALGHVFFALQGSDGQGDQLWASDGTMAGTRQVSAFTSAHPFAFSQLLLPVGDRIYFVPDDGTTRNELWTSDGTTAGTRRVSQLGPVQALAIPGSLAALGSRLLFLAQDNGSVHLFRTDGTPASTARLPNLPLSETSKLFSLPGRVLFGTADLTHGSELWSTDGTDAGTFPLDVPCPGPCSSGPDTVRAFGNGVLFNATDTAGQRALWFTDGTIAGTRRFASVTVEVGGDIGALGGRAFFPAQDSRGVELWTSDGKTGGTALLADLAVAPQVADLNELTAISNRLFFSASEPAGTAPWLTDGTDAGTVPVPTASPVDCQAFTGTPRLAAAGGGLFFVCKGNGDGLYRIGRTDGTADGTVLLPPPLRPQPR